MPKVKDITGKRFGKLVAIRHIGFNNSGNARWLCHCDCGRKHTTASTHLLNGNTTTCGCRSRIKDITGQRFGQLFAIKQTKSDKHNNARWLCKCDCGRKTAVVGRNLRKGFTKSCGSGVHRKQHGYAYHPLYQTWNLMRDRCNNKKSKNYDNYGGRGIQVYEHWNAVTRFITNVIAEIGNRPHGHTFDRIDNDGNYEPGNIKWSTPKEQANNRRKYTRLDKFTTAELVTELKRRIKLIQVPSRS
jgi:hypothetical protein